MAAKTAAELHAIVAAEPLDGVNASTVVSRLARLGEPVRAREPWDRLRALVTGRSGKKGTLDVTREERERRPRGRLTLSDGAARR
jgi:hypothetical protein